MPCKRVRSKYCVFVVRETPLFPSDNVICKYLEQVVYEQIESVYRVVAVAEKPVSSAMWGRFIEIMGGVESAICRQNKYHNPLQQFYPQGVRGCTTILYEKRCSQASEEAVVVEEPALHTNVLDFLQSPVDLSVDLLSIAPFYLGMPRWVKVAELLQWSVVETHRRLLQLEEYLGKNKVSKGIEYLQIRRQKLLCRWIVLVDPVTLVIPLLLDLSVKKERWDEEFEKRLLIYRADEQRLVSVYNYVLQFAPACGLSGLLSKGGVKCDKHVNYTAMYLQETEQYKNTMPWVSLYRRVVRYVEKGMRQDCAEVNFAKCLPPTPAFPHAVYSLQEMANAVKK